MTPQELVRSVRMAEVEEYFRYLLFDASVINNVELEIVVEDVRIAAHYANEIIDYVYLAELSALWGVINVN